MSEANEESCLDELQEYAEQAYNEELSAVMLAKDFRQHYSITIDTMSLLESNLLFAHLLFDCPQKALKFLDLAFLKAAYRICQNRSIKTNIRNKVNIHVRLTALPNLPDIYRANLPNCSDVGQFMCISGTVIRATTSKVLEFRKAWKCKKCKFGFTIDAEIEKGYVFEKPSVCPNPDWCNGKNFALLSTEVDPDFCKDYREVKIQQQFNTLSVGSVPKSMWVILEDDLVETCQPGNDVNVSGVLIQRWKPLSKGSFIEIDLVLFAHNVEVKNKMTPGILSESSVNEFGEFWIDSQKDPLKGRDFILSSICPQVFGLYIVKLAVALILAGGVEKKDGNSRIRGDSHLLLVGDPGTGKSQFLKFASKVCMRAVLTSGIGTTNAGLTVSAVKEGGKWQLEAGALVLADGGVCCIDEFSCIKEQDKTCIHEAMEQQTISVAKAGLVCSLSSKCSILAATNPKGKYDENLSLSENTALASPLLSRFDIILVLLDTYDDNWDKLVSSYILGGRKLSNESCEESSWSLTKVRSYFTLIRNINPRVTAPCDRVLQAYYKSQRSLEGRNFARTTPRLLQSLVRLAEGHARLMFRSEVLVIDAIMAIVLMESSMSGSAILDELTTLHTSFSEDPEAEYRDRANTVLKLLNLEELLEDSENYKFAYQDISVKSLLSKVHVTSDTTKNSYLGDSFSENTTIANYSRNSSIAPTDDVTDHFKRPLPIEGSSYLDIHTDRGNVHALEQITETDNGPENCSLLEKQNKMNSLNNIDEISTVSDLVNAFCDDELQSQDLTLNFPESKVEHKRKAEESIEEVNTKTNEVVDHIADLNRLSIVDFEIPGSDSSHSLSAQPQAKKVCVENKSKLESFKRFTFQRSNRINFAPVADDRGPSNQESSTIGKDIIGKVSPKFNLNDNLNSELEADNKRNSATVSVSPSSIGNPDICKPGPSIVTNNSNGKQIQQKNDTTNVGASNNVRKIQSTHMEPNKPVVTNNANGKQTRFQNDSATSNNTGNTQGQSVEPNKFANPLKKFAFMGRPSKKNLGIVQPTKQDISQASQSVRDTNISSQSAKNIVSTQSSQSVFKRVFSSFVGEIDAEDLEDDLFKM